MDDFKFPEIWDNISKSFKAEIKDRQRSNSKPEPEVLNDLADAVIAAVAELQARYFSAELVIMDRWNEVKHEN